MMLGQVGETIRGRVERSRRLPTAAECATWVAFFGPALAVEVTRHILLDILRARVAQLQAGSRG